MILHKAAHVAEVPPGSAKQATVDGKKIALFNVGGTIYALDDCCPHRGAPLSEGEIVGTEVVCPWHAASFDLTTGKHLCPPAKTGVACYKVEVVGEEVTIEMTRRSPPAAR